MVEQLLRDRFPRTGAIAISIIRRRSLTLACSAGDLAIAQMMTIPINSLRKTQNNWPAYSDCLNASLTGNDTSMLMNAASAIKPMMPALNSPA